MPKVPRRKRVSKGQHGSDVKQGNKNNNPPYPLSNTAIQSRIEYYQAMLAARKVAERGEEHEEDESPPERDEAENRVVVKFFWKQLCCPPKEEWSNRHDGVISKPHTSPHGRWRTDSSYDHPARRSRCTQTEATRNRSNH